MTMLKPFEQRDVVRCSVRMPRAAASLRSALDAAPPELHHGDVVYVLIKATVTGIGFPTAEKDADVLCREYTLASTFGTLVDEADVRKALDTARRRVEDAQGVARLPGTDEPDET